VRISAAGDTDGAGRTRTAETLVEEVAVIVTERLGDHVWGMGGQTWADAIGALLAKRGWRLAMAELGTRGQVTSLFGDVDWVALAEVRPEAGDGEVTLTDLARRIRERAGVEVGLAVRARERGGDTAVSVAVAIPGSEHRETRRAFLGGSHGRTRAALTAASVLFSVLRDAPD
jgi:nicotinamide mononucleotide (NMN) deamidase PncC